MSCKDATGCDGVLQSLGQDTGYLGWFRKVCYESVAEYIKSIPKGVYGVEKKY